MLLLAALADPVRREIVELLSDGELGAGEIAERFPVSRPAVSRHLRLLREAGVVESEVDGQRRTYRLVRAPLAELDAWLGRFRPLHPARVPPGPAGRLDALDTEVRRGRRAHHVSTPTTPVTGPEESDDDRSTG